MKDDLRKQVRALTDDELNFVTGGRVFRITNIRGNAAQFAGSSTAQLPIVTP
jgi:hypothetical protein